MLQGEDRVISIVGRPFSSADRLVEAKLATWCEGFWYAAHPEKPLAMATNRSAGRQAWRESGKSFVYQKKLIILCMYFWHLPWNALAFFSFFFSFQKKILLYSVSYSYHTGTCLRVGGALRRAYLTCRFSKRLRRKISFAQRLLFQNLSYLAQSRNFWAALGENP